LNYSLLNPALYEGYIYKAPCTFDIFQHQGKILLTDDDTYYFEIKELEGKLGQEIKSEGPGSYNITFSNWGFDLKFDSEHTEKSYLDIRGNYSLSKTSNTQRSLPTTLIMIQDLTKVKLLIEKKIARKALKISKVGSKSHNSKVKSSQEKEEEKTKKDSNE